MSEGLKAVKTKKSSGGIKKSFTNRKFKSDECQRLHYFCYRDVR